METISIKKECFERRGIKSPHPPIQFHLILSPTADHAKDCFGFKYQKEPWNGIGKMGIGGGMKIEITISDDGKYFVMYRPKEGVMHSFVAMDRSDLWIRLDDILNKLEEGERQGNGIMTGGKT